MKLCYGLLLAFVSMNLVNLCEAHPAEGKYINLIKSGKYQLVCTIESRQLSADLSNRKVEECILVENKDADIEMVDMLQYMSKSTKPYSHVTYLIKSGVYYDDFQKGKVRENVLNQHLKMRGKRFMEFPAGIYPGQGKTKEDWDKEYKYLKSDILKYFGPIITASKKIANYEVKLIGNGSMALEGMNLPYEEYELLHETGSKLRLFYDNGQLVRILKIMSNTTDSGFIMGVKRETNSYTDVRILQFDDKINKIPELSSNE